MSCSAKKIHFDSELGERAKTLRLKSNLSLDQAAMRSRDLSKATIAKLEDGGGCSSFAVALLAEIYDCTTDDLIPITEDP